MEQLAKNKKSSNLSKWFEISGWVAVIIFTFHACTHMVGASDTWKAIVAGRHYIKHGVNTIDPFSANSLKAGPTQKEIETWPGWAQSIAQKVGIRAVKYWHPTGWINQNWLTGVFFYWLAYESPIADANINSFNSLVYLKFAIYILTAVCVYYICKILRVDSVLAVIFVCFTMFIGRSFFTIRPADFTNLLAAVFLLILVLTAYRNILYIWLIVPLTILWCNLHGGYFYVFIMLVPFTAINFLTSFFPKRFVSIGLKGVYHSIAAGFTAFLAMILFNPFHLTNLTHIFAISIGKHANQWRSANEWHPAFEWKNPVGDARPFLIILILALSVILLWLIVRLLVWRLVNRSVESKENDSQTYQLPRIDLAMAAVAALTIYMAIRSRRFIPIAAISACPLIAMFIDQTIHTISAWLNFHKQKHFIVSPMPKNLQWFLAIITTAAVLFLGGWWGAKFKYVYLDPWPWDAEFNSVFMRMTASYAKPFNACRFIKDNKLRGNIFSYWTEGNFIALGQEPDPNSGRTPLQLFMDGRAQTAYDIKYQGLWFEIMEGGPVAQNADNEKRQLTDDDYAGIGRWLNEKFKEYNVEVVLMPLSRSDTPFVKGLKNNPNWQLVYFDNQYELFVDTTAARGKELFEGIFNGQTIYPDEFSKNLYLAHIAFLFGQGKVTEQQGLEFAIKAFELNPSPAPMQQILFAAKFEKLCPRINDFCRDYVEEFAKNKNNFAKKDGYGNQLSAVILAGNYLEKIAKNQEQTEAAVLYAAKNQEYTKEQQVIIRSKRW